MWPSLPPSCCPQASACRWWHFSTSVLPHSDAHSPPHLSQPGGPCARADGVHQGLPGIHGVAEGAGAGPGRCPGCGGSWGRRRGRRLQAGWWLAVEVLQPRGFQPACRARSLTKAPELLRGTGCHLAKRWLSDHILSIPSKGSAWPCPEPYWEARLLPAPQLPLWPVTKGNRVAVPPCPVPLGPPDSLLPGHVTGPRPHTSTPPMAGEDPHPSSVCRLPTMLFLGPGLLYAPKPCWDPLQGQAGRWEREGALLGTLTPVQ